MENRNKIKRVPTRVHTRELDRKIARNNMKKLGLHQVAKHSYTHGMTLSGKQGETIRHDSFFAEKWHKYAEI